MKYCHHSNMNRIGGHYADLKAEREEQQFSDPQRSVGREERWLLRLGMLARKYDCFKNVFWGLKRWLSG